MTKSNIADLEARISTLEVEVVRYANMVGHSEGRIEALSDAFVILRKRVEALEAKAARR